MKNNYTFIYLLFTICFSIITFAQNKTGINPKETLYIVFNDYVEYSTSDDAYMQLIASNIEIKNSADYFGLQLEKGLLFSDKKLTHLENSRKQIAQRNPKQSTKASRLSHIFRGAITNPTPERLTEIIAVLEKSPLVKYCYLSTNEVVSPPSITSTTTTPDFSNQQTYRGPNPGVDMQYAWDLGYNGTGISVADIEYGFNPDHEDFNSNTTKIADNMTIVSGVDPAYVHHGTAVVGIVGGMQNEYGVTGLAHGISDMVVYPEYTNERGYDRIFAITKALENAKKGDVVMYEMQAFNNSTEKKLVPAEYDKIVWELTKAASDLGVTIVAAAANGTVNLDAPEHKAYNDMGDSGAIIVGGGTPDTNHNKVSYSNYGNRVNLQGWAEKVFTTGEINFGSCNASFIDNNKNRSYTACFSGTSSATPIVASCAIVLQSAYFEQTGNYLTPLQIREILTSTGIPQGTGGNIGPLPNMKAALTKLNADYVLSTPSNSFESNFIVSPNPSSGKIQVVLPAYFDDTTTLTIYSTLGQKIHSEIISVGENNLSIESLPTGIYILEVSDSSKKSIKRIIKR